MRVYICILIALVFCVYNINGQSLRRQIYEDESCFSLVGVYISNNIADCEVVEQCTAFPNGTHFYTQTCPENITLDFPTEFNVAIISPNSTCKEVTTILASVPDSCTNIDIDGNSVVTSSKLTACQTGSFGFGLYNQDCSALNNNLQFVGTSCTKATYTDLTDEFLTGYCATIIPQSDPAPSNDQVPTTPTAASPNGANGQFVSFGVALFLAPFVRHLLLTPACFGMILILSCKQVIYPRVNEWWGGRQLAHLLPKLFFQHFQNTSFVVEETDVTSGTKIIIAFIIGFISQTDSTRAYIHFVGVDPDHRKKQLGRKLYELFFETVRAKGVKTVNSITSLVNKTSIGFHKAVGFSCLGSALSEDGIAYYPNYEDGKDCVVFEKQI